MMSSGLIAICLQKRYRSERPSEIKKALAKEEKLAVKKTEEAECLDSTSGLGGIDQVGGGQLA